MNNENTLVKKLNDAGEYFAAGLFEKPDAAAFVRYSRAYRRYFETRKLNEYSGESLYPCGSKYTGLLCFPDYSFTLGVQWEAFEKKCPFAYKEIEQEFFKFESSVPVGHRVGGNMYTHSYPNFARVIKEGFDSYEKRIEKIADPDIREGLLDVMAGIRAYHGKVLKMLSAKAPDSDLYKALLKVPFSPAETLYEGLVCLNFVYYLDHCDNIGRLDADLIHLYKGEDVTEILRQFFKNVDANSGWSGSLGPDYNPLTLQCIKSVKGLRRPSLELRVTPDMSDELWEAAIDSICAGGGSPSLYNEAGYQSSLKKLFPEIPEADLKCFGGGGCTETMLAGISNVGSLDAGINLALVFEEYMRKNLGNAKSFEAFYQGFIAESGKLTEEVLEGISKSQKSRAEHRPQPVRTLLIDDCIDRGKDYNAGGARYYWSVVNIAGIVNVLDSLSVIKKLVFEDKVMSGSEMLGRLDAGDRLLQFKNVPRHGVNNEESDALAARFSADICAPFKDKTPYLGGKFLPSSIQFLTYIQSGSVVGATPDGRLAGEPLADCIGAVHNNDTKGATALLGSAASLCQSEFAGTPVLNITLDAEKSHSSLRPLVLGYFEKGGMQLQVTCLKVDELMDAVEHPEKYPNLIVRLGGYSEYFDRLSKPLRESVAKRTVYENI